MVITSSKKLVVIQGLDDYIVAESKTLSFVKEDEHRIKHFMRMQNLSMGRIVTYILSK